MGKLLGDIQYGLLSDYELYWLQEKVESEKNKRKNKAQEHVDVIYADDGSEGMFCRRENFHKIPSDQLHEYITETLDHGSSVTFSLEKYEKNEYMMNCAQYEWQLSDGSNTKVIEEDDEEGMSNN